MTINKLHKKLTKLIENGDGRKQVKINKRTFNHDLEGDGCCILPVESCDIETIPLIDDDGGTLNDSGEEKLETVAVLSGV